MQNGKCVWSGRHRRTAEVSIQLFIETESKKRVYPAESVYVVVTSVLVYSTAVRLLLKKEWAKCPINVLLFLKAIKSCFAYGVNELSSEKNCSHLWSESWDAYSIGLLRRDGTFAGACCRRCCEVRFIWKRNSTPGHKVGKHLLRWTPDIFQLPSKILKFYRLQGVG